MKSREYTFNGFRLSGNGLELLDVDNKPIKVRNKTLEVLKYLVNNVDKNVSREELAEHVWQGLVVSDDSLTQCISELRTHIGDKNKKILRTVPRFGYRLLADPSLDSIVPSDSSVDTELTKSLQCTDHHESTDRDSVTESPRDYRLLFSLLIVLLATAVLYTYTTKSSIIVANSEQVKPAIAIVDFESLSDDVRWSRIAKGITTDLVVEMAKNSWLRILHLPDTTSLDSVLKKEVNPKFVLSGTLQNHESNLRISAILKVVETDEIVWSKQWQKTADNIFLVQDEITESTNASVAAEWTGEIAAADRTKAQQHPKNLDVYELYLLGVEEKHKFNKQGTQKAIDYFEKALDIDPNYARAWSDLSLVYLNAWRGVDDQRQYLEDISSQIEAATNAYRIQPHDPGIMLSYSFVTAMQGDSEQTDRLIRDAVDKSWNNPDLLMYATWAGSFRTSGDLGTSMWGERAFSLNPKAPPWYSYGLATAYFLERKADLALKTLAGTPEGLDRWWVEAASYAATGNSEAAYRASAKMIENYPLASSDFANNVWFTLDLGKRDWLSKNMQLAGFP